MKKLLALFIIGISLCANAQKTDLKPEGFTPVVIELQDKSSEQIYTGIIKYINKNFKNPNEVLKGDIKNEYIRLNGFSNKMWCYKALGINHCIDQEYSVEVDVKDGKFRFTFIPNQGYIAGTTNALMYSYKSFFKKDGSVRNMYTDAKDSFELSVNNMIEEIVNEVNGKTESDNDW